MFRKIILAATAVAALGAAALAPTSASAFPHPHPHWGGGGHFGWFGGGGYYGDSDGCFVVRRVVPTPFGPRLRRVVVCD